MTEPAAPVGAWGSARRGAVAIGPIALGVMPYGLIAGYAAIDIGLRIAEAVGFSVFFFAGAAQLAAIDLLGAGAPVGVVLLTVLVINARLVMYSASLAPHLSTEPVGRRGLAAYLLSDHAFAVAIVPISGAPGRIMPLWYYLGAALPLWACWQLWTILGAVAGSAIPDGLQLGFAVPLAFLALLVPAITDRPTLVAAVVAGAVATSTVELPANLGMPLGAVAGIAAGVALARRRPPRSGAT